MRLVLALVASLWPAAGLACNDTILALTGWDAVKEGNGATLTLTFESHAAKPFRMIDAVVWFGDVLGPEVRDGVDVQRDLHLSPKETFTQQSSYAGMARYASIKHEDVTTEVCVRSVLYDDGTIERFTFP